MCRKKAKRKRDEAEAAVRAQEAAVADDPSSASAAEDVDPRSSGSDGAEDRDEPKAEEASENIDDMLTPAQRRFREKQLSREVRSLFPIFGHVRIRIAATALPVTCCKLLPSEKAVRYRGLVTCNAVYQ